MFGNYPLYARQVLDAAKVMSPAKRKRAQVAAGGITAALVAGACVVAGGTHAAAVNRISVMMDGVKGNLGTVPIEVKVEDSGEGMAAALGDDVALSGQEQATIAEEIKSSIADADFDAAESKLIDSDTAEIVVKTPEGVPVTFTVKKADDGSFAVESAVAQIDRASVQEKKEAADNPDSTPEQQSQHAVEYAAFDTAAFKAAAGIDGAVEGEELDRAVADKMVVIAENLVMALPSSYEAQPSELEVDPAVPVPSPEELAAAEQAGTLPAWSYSKPRSASWKDGDGSSVSLRVENLGEAFSRMSGLDAVNKMMGYWQETATSVAEGAGQSLKNPDAGYATEVFYDADSGLWGYWGTVSFTDGARDVVYDRVVFIDERSEQMFTVSYRHDGGVDAGGALALDAFKAMFSHAPAEGAAADAYAAKLDEVKIAYGHAKTAPEERAEAEKAAEEAPKAEEPAEGGQPPAEGEQAGEQPAGEGDAAEQPADEGGEPAEPAPAPAE